ncbi:Phosphatidylinositolglycan class N-domain-containing protein [Epithele typhae]|uniref:Phosphatidylinositolglycan class N-domain-containing protein n=1 Tax=Epithele typhae TaxID=378194 RepID=UPI00200764EF|nr:Phosphatidylinositolglycan class N-domain-containing protein [Epithele typhae]KAH9916426.1 Phosphatidylinositolglycan class N-domain-containing protein [Epithele typhae]
MQDSACIEPTTAVATYSPVWRLLLIGLVFHFLCTGTVFYCYLTDPIVQDMQQHLLKTVEAKRLVLVGRACARTSFSRSTDSPLLKIVAPHPKFTIEDRGAWGISHTHVPTESRLGHVALIGGIYEDVFAMKKVGFDSVFNQPGATFSFGSPEPLPCTRAEQLLGPREVETWWYDEEDEDFTEDATSLEVWTMEHPDALLPTQPPTPVCKASRRYICPGSTPPVTRTARIQDFSLGRGVAFVWLAIAAEGLFYVTFSLTLTTWVEVKAALRQTAAQKPRAEDLRIAVFFLLFVQVAAFGAGNVAPISTVYCLVPVLDPFLMVFKIVAPRIILAICFSISNARLSPSPFSLFLVALT